MKAKIINLNNELISNVNYSDKILSFIEGIGGKIIRDNKDYRYIYNQIQIIKENNIERMITSTIKKIDVFNNHKNININIYLISLNPDYHFVMTKMGGVLGYSLSNNIFLLINAQENIQFKKRLKSILVHEINHILRNSFYKLNQESFLIDHFINEGLAENYVEENLGKEYLNPWGLMYQLREFNSFIEVLNNPYINNKDKIYSIMHGNEEEDIPLWLGYSYGYHLIKFVKKTTSIHIEELTMKDRIFFESYNKVFLKKIMKEE